MMKSAARSAAPPAMAAGAAADKSDVEQAYTNFFRPFMPIMHYDFSNLAEGPAMSQVVSGVIAGVPRRFVVHQHMNLPSCREAFWMASASSRLTASGFSIMT